MKYLNAFLFYNIDIDLSYTLLMLELYVLLYTSRLRYILSNLTFITHAFIYLVNIFDMPLFTYYICYLNNYLIIIEM